MKYIILATLIFVFVACNKEKEMEQKPSKHVLMQVESDPTISFNIWFNVGSVNDPDGKEGIAYLTAQLMVDGATQNNSYEQILEKLDPIAGSYSTKVDKEMTTFKGRIHKDNIDLFYSLFTDAILNPRFSEDDFQRIKKQTISSIENDLRYSSDEELGKAVLYHDVFEGTSYEHLTIGTVSSLNSITIDDVKKFYNENFNKNNYKIGLAGGFDNQFVDKLDKDLQKLPEGKENSVSEIITNPIDGLEVNIIEKDNNSTAISFGFPIPITRADEDYYALDIFRSWFGEHRNQSSHLYEVIREKRGMNYGDYAYIEAFLNGGSYSMPVPNNPRSQQIFEVWIRPVQHIHRHFALRAAMRELQLVIENGLTQEQFDVTKQFLYKYALHYAPALNTRLGYQIDSKFYGVNDNGNYISHYREVIKKLTLEDVNKVIKKYIQFDNIKFAIITKDAESFKKDLISNIPSPVTYDTPKPEEVLEEDKIISNYKINFIEDKIKITPVEELFK